MRECLETGIHQVNALLGSDTDFQSLTEQLDTAYEHYSAVVEKLPPEDQDIIEDYIALCSELEYQKTYTAYYCGRRNG
jgi:hypothetical protein